MYFCNFLLYPAIISDAVTSHIDVSTPAIINRIIGSKHARHRVDFQKRQIINGLIFIKKCSECQKWNISPYSICRDTINTKNLWEDPIASIYGTCGYFPVELCHTCHVEHDRHIYKWSLIIIISASHVHILFIVTTGRFAFCKKGNELIMSSPFPSSLTYWGRGKWTPFRRRHFQMHFLEWKCLNSD